MSTGPADPPAPKEAVENEPASSPPAEPTPAVVAAPINDAPTMPLSSGGVDLHMVGRTDVGLVREHNEDNFICVRLDDDARDPAVLLRHTLGPVGTMLVVCDGMGGAAAGEVASSMAVETLPLVMRGDVTAPAPDGTTDEPAAVLARKLRYATEEANGRIFREQQVNLARAGMGTTMTAALLRGDEAIIAQVGDSRCYVLRQGVLTQVTRDQSLVNQLLETGQITVEQAKYFEHSNVILQALGVQEEVEVQLSRVMLRRGDRIMLCSDGLVGVVGDEEICAVMGSVDDPGESARLLIELANGGGGPDNITVVVAHISGEGVPLPTEADTIEYKTWLIDPTPEPKVYVPQIETFANAAPTETTPQVARPPVRPLELFSMAVILGLIAGSVIVGFAMYQRAVPCRVRSLRAGLTVLTDGRDSGARTIEGEVPLRLRPGHHRVALTSTRHGAGDALLGEQVLDVRQGESCLVQFDVAAGVAPEVGAPERAEAPGTAR